MDLTLSVMSANHCGVIETRSFEVAEVLAKVVAEAAVGRMGGDTGNGPVIDNPLAIKMVDDPLEIGPWRDEVSLDRYDAMAAAGLG